MFFLILFSLFLFRVFSQPQNTQTGNSPIVVNGTLGSNETVIAFNGSISYTETTVNKTGKSFQAPLFYARLFCPRQIPFGSKGYCALLVEPFFPNISLGVQYVSYNATEACKCPVKRRYIYTGWLPVGAARGNILLLLPIVMNDKAVLVEIRVMARVTLGEFSLGYGKWILAEISAGGNVTMYLVPGEVHSLGYESISGYLVVAANKSAVMQGSLEATGSGHVSLESLDIQIVKAGDFNAFKFGAEVRDEHVKIDGNFKLREYGSLRKLNFTFTPAEIYVYSIKKYGMTVEGNKVQVQAIIEGGPLTMDGYGEEGLRGFVTYELVNGSRGVAPLTLKGESATVELPGEVGYACSYTGFPSFNKTLVVTSCNFNTRLWTAEVTLSPNPIFKWEGIPMSKQKLVLTIRARGGLPEELNLGNVKILKLDVNRVIAASTSSKPLLPEELASMSDVVKEFSLNGIRFSLVAAGLSYGETVLQYEGRFEKDFNLEELPVNYTFDLSGRLWTMRGPVQIYTSATLKVLPYKALSPDELKGLALTLAVLGLMITVFSMTLNNFLLFNRSVRIDWMGLARSIAYIVLSVTLLSFLDSLASPLKDNYLDTILAIDDRIAFVIELFNGLASLEFFTYVTGGVVSFVAKSLLASGQGRAIGLVLQGLNVVGSTFMAAGTVLGEFTGVLSEMMSKFVLGFYGIKLIVVLFYSSSYILVALLILSPGLMSFHPTRGLGAYVLGVFGTLWVGLPALLGFTNYMLFKFGLDTTTLRHITSLVSLPLGVNPLGALEYLGYTTAATSIGWIFGVNGGFGQAAMMYVDMSVKAILVPLALYVFDLAVLLVAGISLARWMAGNSHVTDFVSSAFFTILRGD